MGLNKLQKIYTNTDSKVSINEAFSEERFDMHEFLDSVWLQYEKYCVEEGKDPDINEFLKREWCEHEDAGDGICQECGLNF